MRPHAEHEEAFLAAVARSRTLHGPWTQPPADSRAYGAHVARGRAVDMEMFHVLVDETQLAGVINASNIVLGAFRSAYLGYYAFAPWAGRGVMHAGLELVLDIVFGELGLHRVEANIQPHNAPSIALVRGLGFSLEGFSPRYLFIDGAWRDHERWALLADDRPSA